MIVEFERECNAYLRRGGKFTDCRRVDLHTGPHTGLDDRGRQMQWTDDTADSGFHVAGAGFNRPVTPSEYNTQEEVPRKELEAQLVDCRNMICDLREENEGLKTRIEKMKAKLGRKQHVIETHVKFIQRVTDERDQYRRANVDLEERLRLAGLGMQSQYTEQQAKIEELTAQRDAFAHELAEKRKRIMELTELTTQVAPAADNDPRFIVRMQLLEELNTALMRIWQLDLRRRQEDSF